MDGTTEYVPYGQSAGHPVESWRIEERGYPIRVQMLGAAAGEINFAANNSGGGRETISTAEYNYFVYRLIDILGTTNADISMAEQLGVMDGGQFISAESRQFD
ncbi:MAG: hypothetical protein AAF583_16340 [Pseudomonadota bacterium]